MEAHQIPVTKPRRLPRLEPFQVAGRIRAFRKLKSMVRGDIFPALVTKYGDFLALPLCSIYNAITETHVWPRIWKREFVTAIPKKSLPAGVNDLRNISCTMLPSKIYESYILNWAQEEVGVKENQYGGIKGCSTSHLLVGVMDDVMRGLEDDRASVMLTSIDYAKAFNRLSFQYCLAAFARLGASTPIIELLATFLSNRMMTVRVGESWSTPRPVFGGVPQGSILGVFLFNISTDDLEDSPTNPDSGSDNEAERVGEQEASADSAAEETSRPTTATSTPAPGRPEYFLEADDTPVRPRPAQGSDLYLPDGSN